MKIAILTRRAGFNMGSSLQAYAMFKLFSKLGNDVVVINYDEYANYLLWRIKPIFHRLVYILFSIFPFLRFFCRKKYTYLVHVFSQQAKFKDFESNFIPLTDRKFRSSKELRHVKGKFDTYVCGSDQIWSPQMYDPAYFLDFVDSSGKTIAYAPSIGVTESSFISENAKKLIRKLDYISCREREGAVVLSDITKKQVETVLDPTLMIDKEEWEQIIPAQRIIKEKYILTYFLHTQHFENNIPYTFIKELQREKGLPVINIQMYNMQQVVVADKHLYDCGPLDFLNLIKNAEYVITNSFHCCVFSFIFERTFFVSQRFRKDDKEHDQNPRIYTLLETLNSQDALIIDGNNKMKETANVGNSKDLTLLKIRRKKSFDFIQNALNQ